MCVNDVVCATALCGVEGRLDLKLLRVGRKGCFAVIYDVGVQSLVCGPSLGLVYKVCVAATH